MPEPDLEPSRSAALATKVAVSPKGLTNTLGCVLQYSRRSLGLCLQYKPWAGYAAENAAALTARLYCDTVQPKEEIKRKRRVC